MLTPAPQALRPRGFTHTPAPQAQDVDARSSARCITRTLDPLRDNLPPICIKQLASPDTTASTPARSMASIFSSRIATEISGYLTENVPPKPQQASAFWSSTNSAPRTFLISVLGSLFK